MDEHEPARCGHIPATVPRGLVTALLPDPVSSAAILIMQLGDAPAGDAAAVGLVSC